MFDAGSRYDAPGLQRAQGELRIGFHLRDGLTVLDDLRQSGCLKARMPRRTDRCWAEAVILNSSGGVAAGDRLLIGVSIGPGAQVLVSTQAAERIYRSRPGETPAHVRTCIEIQDGARGEWLPQETILFDGAALDRALDVNLTGTARFLGLEVLLFGRTLMGEILSDLRLRDLIRITRNGIPAVHDSIRIEGNADALLRRPAVAAGMRAAAALFYAAPDAPERLAYVRAALDGAEAGASATEGMLVARILAPDGAALRRLVASVLHELRERPLPRVWMC